TGKPNRTTTSTPNVLERNATEPTEISSLPDKASKAMPEEMATTGAMVCSIAKILSTVAKCRAVREKNKPVKITTNQKPSREMKVGIPKRCPAAGVSTGEPLDGWALWGG